MSVPAGSASLQFCDMQWHVDIAPFWDTVRELKLHTWKRDEPCVATRATIAIDVRPVQRSTAANAVLFDRTSLAIPTEAATRSSAVATAAVVVQCRVPGTLLNFNHYEDFTAEDPKQVLQDAIWDHLLGPLVQPSTPGAKAVAEAWRCAPYLFSLIRTFADVKGYVYHHREAFPAVLCRGSRWAVKTALLGEHDDDTAAAVSALSAQDATRVCAALADQVRRDPALPFAPLLCHWDPDLTVEPFTPERWQACARATPVRAPVLAFHDVSAEPLCLGWPALNFLTCVRLTCPDTSRACVYAVRQGAPATSLYLALTCEPLPARVPARPLQCGDLAAEVTVLGWKSKKPVVLDLSRERDPARRADEDSSLNLRLMKWQQQPDLALDKLAACRALLLGAGTLGCNVARNLLCWGVRHLTLVDRGHVSFSNLARQSLFSLHDATTHRHKAMAAADALNQIIPAPDTITGVDLTIHMPGYRFAPEAAGEVAADVARLTELIRSHDVVFVLTDSREARWLPTVLAAAHGVPVVNVAIGFSGFEVQRHGVVRREQSRSNAVPQPREDAAEPDDAGQMGCYFCGKLDAVVNSTAHRTLDRQCSVTRPGVSAIASATATELLAAVYQHPQGFLCAHSTNSRGTALGAVPQMLIGEVGGYTVKSIACERGELCEACSEPVLRAYESEGTPFLMRCLADSDYLDTICGMKALREMCEANVEALALDARPPLASAECPSEDLPDDMDAEFVAI